MTLTSQESEGTSLSVENGKVEFCGLDIDVSVGCRHHRTQSSKTHNAVRTVGNWVFPNSSRAFRVTRAVPSTNISSSISKPQKSTLSIHPDRGCRPAERKTQNAVGTVGNSRTWRVPNSFGILSCVCMPRQYQQRADASTRFRVIFSVQFHFVLKTISVVLANYLHLPLCPKDAAYTKKSGRSSSIAAL